jgi:hypothetical protein
MHPLAGYIVAELVLLLYMNVCERVSLARSAYVFIRAARLWSFNFVCTHAQRHKEIDTKWLPCGVYMCAPGRLQTASALPVCQIKFAALWWKIPKKLNASERESLNNTLGGCAGYKSLLYVYMCAHQGLEFGRWRCIYAVGGWFRSALLRNRKFLSLMALWHRPQKLNSFV